MTQYKTFETERLILIPTTELDAAFIFELVNSPKWLQFIGDRNVKNIDDAKAYIANRMTPQLQTLGYGNYTVIRKADNAKLGICGLYDRAYLEGIDLGFAFLPIYEKQGYAYESALAIRDAGLSIFNIKKMVAITTKEHVASQQLLHKLGFVFQKIIQMPNDPEDLMLFELPMQMIAEKMKS